MKYSIVILIVHFGKWPEWINFFIESCTHNTDIEWVIFSDCGPTENTACNVRLVDISFDEYKGLIRNRLHVDFDPPSPYKLCDVRPAFGVVHSEYIKGFDFYGYGDLDVIYGRIRDFYDTPTLGQYDLLSTHPERTCGHFLLMRNRLELVEAFSRISGWEVLISDEAHHMVDERQFTGVIRDLCSGQSRVSALFQERYSSPGPAKTMSWFWKDGLLTNEFYSYYRESVHRGFLYLHFADWRSSRWYKFHNYIKDGALAPWEGLQRIVQMDWRRAKSEGFMISPDGILPIKWPLYAG